MPFNTEENAFNKQATLHESFIHFYGQYKEKIYQQAVSACPENADDIVQDVFLSLWRQKHRWDEIDNIQAYLFFCTRNRTLDHFRQLNLERKNLGKWKEQQVLFDSPEQKIESSQIQRLHEEAVSRLPAQQRKVYTLRRFYGWKRKKIADELKLSDDTVKQHMQVALRSVKRFMTRETSAEDVRAERPGAFRTGNMFSEY